MLNTIKKFFAIPVNPLKKHRKTVEKINEKEPLFATYSDRHLLEAMQDMREDENKDAHKEEYLVDVFAITREAAKRVFGMRHYDVQLLGGMCLTEGDIAEMQTGEGKTLVATCPALYNALMGNKVHIVTVNDYLARRDFEQMSQLYKFLGFSTGLIISTLNEDERRVSYSSDIIYATNNELGFDYLRDNMKDEKNPRVQQSLDYAIIDEVDSILIDESRTPLIIAGQGKDFSEDYIKMANIVRHFKEGEDFTRDKENKKLIIATEQGIQKAEKGIGVESMFSLENAKLLNIFNQSLKANFSFDRDKDYVVMNNEVNIVDDFTGRIMEGRRYSDGLHQAIEAKEGVPLKEESQTVAQITYQNFFRLYKKLSGMTGTAKTEEDEFLSIYKMPVVTIPKNKPSERLDRPNLIFRTKEAKYRAVVEKVEECHTRKQPILVGTTSIEASEHISSLLQKKGIPHEVLNAKHDDKEAEIIAQAGRIGAVTIATNMAGRGTDIVPEQGVDELGGLFILGTEKHESRRIDNQLKGRTARQGAKGETEFYLSLEDDLFKYFGGERLTKTFEMLQIDLDDSPVDNKLIAKMIDRCQKKIEAKNFDIRKHLLQYDDVLNKQRLVIYEQREQIKNADKEFIEKNLLAFIEEIVKTEILDVYANPKQYPEEWQLEEMVKRLDVRFSTTDLVAFNEIDGLSKTELDDVVLERVKNIIKFKETVLGEEFFWSIMKTALLRFTDSAWTEQINNMASLQEGISLRAYGQLDPLVEYKKEAIEMFEYMTNEIKQNFVSFALGLQIQMNKEEESSSLA